jgi:excisionase family DNA binding protein
MNKPKKEKQTMQTQTTTGGELQLITIDELAERLRIHPDTLRGLYRRGKIPGIKLGYRTLRFDYANVLAALRQAGDPAANNAPR